MFRECFWKLHWFETKWYIAAFRKNNTLSVDKLLTVSRSVLARSQRFWTYQLVFSTFFHNFTLYFQSDPLTICRVNENLIPLRIDIRSLYFIPIFFFVSNRPSYLKWNRELLQGHVSFTLHNWTSIETSSIVNYTFTKKLSRGNLLDQSLQ